MADLIQTTTTPIDGECISCGTPGMVGLSCGACGGHVATLDIPEKSPESGQSEASEETGQLGKADTIPGKYNDDLLDDEDDDTAIESFEALADKELEEEDEAL